MSNDLHLISNSLKAIYDTGKPAKISHIVETGIVNPIEVFTNSGAISQNDTIVVKLNEDGSFDKSYRNNDLAGTIFEQVVAIVESYNKGFPVKVENVETYNRYTYGIAGMLGSIVDRPCNIHMFTGGAGKGSFGWHTDTSAVFCYMIAGHKKMFVEDQEFDLYPGDWLYMPDGILHKAENQTDTVMISCGFFSEFWNTSESYYV